MEQAAVHLVVLAGGTGERLGGRSKADLVLGGTRLLDRLLTDLDPHVTGHRVVVAPESVAVPDGVTRVMEEPPGGGPLAGIGAGVEALARAGASEGDLLLLLSVDTPGAGHLAPPLLRAMGARTTRAAVCVADEPDAFRQYLQAVYRIGALREVLRTGGELHHRSVRRLLEGLDPLEVRVPAHWCRDLDTPDDLAFWDARSGE